MKKIAIHAPRVSYYQGGAERYILNLLIELSKENRKISLITYDAPKKTEWFLKFSEEFKGKIYLLGCKEMDNNFYKFAKASKPSLWDKESKIFGKETKKFYEKNKFDSIICHYAVDCLFLPKNQKIYLHLHGLPDKKREIENKAVKIPNKIIAVSKYVGEGWKRLHNIKKKMYVVPNGIFLEDNKTQKKTEDIIFFGRLIKIKGIGILLKSIKILNNKDILPKVKIIGEGPEKNNLILLAKELKLKKVSFLGKIKDKKLFNIISSSKISVFPSYKREGIMTTLLEASKCQSVIVASNSCSNNEFIKNNFNGILFEQKNYKDLASKIKIVLFNQELRKKLTKNSFETLKEFTWQKQARKLEKIYY